MMPVLDSLIFAVAILFFIRTYRQLYDNRSRMISNFKQQVRELLYKVLKGRGEMKSYTRKGFVEMMKYYKLPNSKICFSLFR